MQPTGAFKIRGAYNMLAQLSPDARAAGVITYSSGNHGQAVAFAAQLLGVTAVVVMPETASRVKVEGPSASEPKFCLPVRRYWIGNRVRNRKQLLVD
jgi:threonine dehydratase